MWHILSDAAEDAITLQSDARQRHSAVRPPIVAPQTSTKPSRLQSLEERWLRRIQRRVCEWHANGCTDMRLLHKIRSGTQGLQHRHPQFQRQWG